MVTEFTSVQFNIEINHTLDYYIQDRTSFYEGYVLFSFILFSSIIRKDGFMGCVIIVSVYERSK